MKEANHGSLDQWRVRASAQRPPPHARISISRRRQAGTGPPSLHLHTNSCAPATHRLIKAMHLFMTELIKQRKRWSQLWKHISPRGNCLWSRSPQAPSGHRFWIFLTYKEKANYNALKNLLWGNGVMVQDILQGIFGAAWTGPIITCIGHRLEDEQIFHHQVLCFAFLSGGIWGNSCSLHAWCQPFNKIRQL